MDSLIAERDAAEAEVSTLRVLLLSAEKYLRSAGGWAHYGGDPDARLKVGDQGVRPGRCVSLMPVDAQRCSCGLDQLLIAIRALRRS